MKYAKVLKITRTIYVLESEADIEKAAFADYFADCDADLNKDEDIVEVGTNDSFGKSLGWWDGDDDEEAEANAEEEAEERAMHRAIMGDEASDDDLL